MKPESPGSAADVRARRLQPKELDKPDEHWPGFDPSPPLGPEAHKRFQSVAALLNFSAQDRPELLYSVKELMRRMSCPTELDETRLKRVVRFIRTLPRMVAQYAWNPISSELEVYTDSDHAGCTSTRKSTLGGCILWGGRFVKAWSKTMDILALSSGESELGGVVKACTEGMGLQAVLRDFGINVNVKILSDATAAIGMVRRMGLGRVRHLATADLWVQQRVRDGSFVVAKYPGCDNGAAPT